MSKALYRLGQLIIACVWLATMTWMLLVFVKFCATGRFGEAMVMGIVTLMVFGIGCSYADRF